MAAPLHVLIVGGGVAALEATLALRALAEDRVDIELLAPDEDFVYRPLAVAEPFRQGEARRFPLARLVELAGGRLTPGTLHEVDLDRRVARTAEGAELGWDVVLLALGARTREGVPGSLTFRGPDDRAALTELIDEAASFRDPERRALLEEHVQQDGSDDQQIRRLLADHEPGIDASGRDDVEDEARGEEQRRNPAFMAAVVGLEPLELGHHRPLAGQSRRWLRVMRQGQVLDPGQGVERGHQGNPPPTSGMAGRGAATDSSARAAGTASSGIPASKPASSFPAGMRPGS